MVEDLRVSEPALFHCGWQELIDSAEAAACQAGRRLAARCSLGELRRTGRGWIRVEPLDSPVAGWLYRNGYGDMTESRDGVLIPVNLGAAELYPAGQAARKACSVLVVQAYTNAYCSVLAEEAGVTASPVVESHRPSTTGLLPTPSALTGSAAFQPQRAV